MSTALNSTNDNTMQTECPHCHSIFRITEAQLDQAEGQVRCGHCLAILDGRDNIHEHHDIEMIADDKDDAEIDLLSPVIPDENPEHVLPDVIPPELRAETRNKKKQYGFLGSLFWSLAILLMIVMGMVQYAYYDRAFLVQFSELRPWLEKLCVYAKCELPDPRDPARIELSSKNIFSHPNHENALMVSGTMVNQAEFEQDFPQVELRFENIRGQSIAGRRFKPEEYLGIPKDTLSKMQPGNPVSFNIELIDPGKDVVSYEFNFL